MISNVIQPMPELAAEQLDSLRADIAANGVLVPVVIDQFGRILDGNHRAAIATELGLDYPTIIVTVIDDADAWDKAVTLNCSRRHMTREQVREVIKGEILRRPDDSDRAIARRVGCSPSTVGAVRLELRRDAEDITERLRNELDRIRDQLAAAAMLRHHENHEPWQAVGDILEHAMQVQVSNLDSDGNIWTPAKEVTSRPPYAALWGDFFDSIRAYDCPTACVVCVSNLDTEAVTK